MNNTPDILQKILQRKAEEIEDRSSRISAQELEERIESAAPTRGFVERIEYNLAQGRPAIIAEIKKASPSKGVIRADFDPQAIAQSYEQGGATCLSVLTDVDFFQGSDDYIEQVKQVCSCPVLRKDFIVDPYQVYEARAIGADCILLIVAALDDAQLKELYQLARRLDMDVLVEVHDAQEMERALLINARLVGVNNRNLRTFETRLETTLDLKSRVPEDRILVTESAIHTQADVALMRSNNVNVFLVGEAFMRADNPGEKLAELFS